MILLSNHKTAVLDNEGTGRIEAFSDGVFAVAITLLILEIKVPSHSEVETHGLLYMLMQLWPSYLAFITSFLSILMIWVKHHWIFTLIERTDHAFLYCNGVLLFLITFLPFPTALLAEYLLHEDAQIAATLYTATVLAIALAFKMLWWHATRDKHLMPSYASRALRIEARQITLQNRYGPPLYGLAFAASFASELISVAGCLLIALFFAVKDGLTQESVP